MQKRIAQFQHLLARRLEEYTFGDRPAALYEPIRYIMALGGKRLRSTLTMLGYRLFKSDPETILDQALAIEVFHNFTLMHDDIMDNAPLRRGQPAVHKKWNANTAILSGDAMLVKAYDLLLSAPASQLPEVITLFNHCATQVCEGQQLDMVFETKPTVSEGEYLEMITLKTAALLGASLEMGALLAGAGSDNRAILKGFGINIGIGFQLMDDLLDVYADKEKFGKQVGGDIMANKKTFLLINALDRADEQQKKALDRWLAAGDSDPAAKVAAVTGIYDRLNIRQVTEDRMNEYFEKALQLLKKLDAPLSEKAKLKEYAKNLIGRQY